MSEQSPPISAERDAKFSAEREITDSMVRIAEDTLDRMRDAGRVRVFKPHSYWEGPSFEETATVDLSEEAAKTLESLGYSDARQAYLVKTGSYGGEGSWRGFGGAYVRGRLQTDYELRILTGNELGKNDKHPNPDAFLGRNFATISPECPIRLNERLNTEAQVSDNAELTADSLSRQALEQVMGEIHNARATDAEPKFVASRL